jgi:DNA-binding PadR family transcriptional regulator
MHGRNWGNAWGRNWASQWANWSDVRGPQGPPPWVGQLLGGWGPGHGGRARGPRARRGDVRAAILDVLHEGEQLNGYQIIQRITERSRGAWRPSPGSVYPTIAQLEDEGLAETVADDGRKQVRLTDAGRAYVAQRPEELAAVWEPFESDGEGEQVALPPVVGQLLGAVWQIITTGSADQQERAAEILADTRRRLFGLLADGPEDDLEETRGPVPEEE